MKTLFITLSFLVSINCFAQDTAKSNSENERKIHNELGANTTLLLKQIFNLSNNTFPTLPYDLTYKLIIGKSAIRVGLGASISNSSVETTTTSTNSTTSTVPGPDEQVPTFTKSTNFYYRIGWERRYRVAPRVGAYWGVDFAGQSGTTKSQSSQTFNNLPSNYSYTKTTDDISIMSYGGGPVVGIQFFMTKRLSVSTELPIYYQYSIQKETIDNYQNQLFQTFPTIQFASSENMQTQTTTGTKLSITLPVTLYLSIKF